MKNIDKLSKDYADESYSSENTEQRKDTIIDFKAGYKEGKEESVQAVMDLFFALKNLGGKPTLKDLVKLAKRIRKSQ